jgi:hypothetical protein
MANPTGRREEALRSALDRLNMPMMICDESRILQPLNERATVLFEAENLQRYTVESSGRSQKGPKRWLVLLLDPVREASLDEQSAIEVRNIFEKSGTHSRAEFLAAVLRTK